MATTCHWVDGFPQALLYTNRNMGQGQFNARQPLDRHDALTCVTWMDSKPVNLLTTTASPLELTMPALAQVAQVGQAGSLRQSVLSAGAGHVHDVHARCGLVLPARVVRPHRSQDSTLVATRRPVHDRHGRQQRVRTVPHAQHTLAYVKSTLRKSTLCVSGVTLAK